MADRRPSFLIFLADDHGYGDLSCMGGTDVRTPYLDAVAASGARFTDWYSNSPVCSPARASLLTGRYPGNAGVRSILAGHRTAPGLSPDVPTVATALKALGYRTAMFGKWHLGLAEGSRPNDHGFEEWFGFLAGWVDYYSHVYYQGQREGNTIQIHDLWENGEEVHRDGEYMTELIAERAVDFVQRAASDANRPFLLYVPFSAPHYPMHAPPGYLDRFPDLPPDRRIMAAMLSAMDDAVGAVCDELRRHGRLDDTLIFFQSDNGPSRESCNWLDGRSEPFFGGCACPLKGHKFSLFDGGIRSPALMSWPATIPAGQVLSGIGIAMDIFPTLLNAAGGDPSGYELDGADVLPMVASGAPSPHASSDLYWEMGRQTAVRRGRWKLVLNGQVMEGTDPVDDVFLADLETDPGETINLRDGSPQMVEELREAAERWRRGIEERWEHEWKPRRRPPADHPIDARRV
jgi:arylsulfatase A-like enzyme